MNSGFRTSSIQASSQNKIEYAKLDNWVQYGFLMCAFLFVMITTIFWGELLFITFPKSIFLFYLIMIAYIFTMTFPIFACGMGYMWSKQTEYNRMIDSTSILGGIAGQLAMNSGNITRGFFDAIETGRQLEQEVQLRASDIVEQPQHYTIDNVPPLTDENRN